MVNYSKQFPFPAKIVERVLLSQVGSTKKTYHISLDLAGADFHYRPGDALAIFPENPPEMVEKVLRYIEYVSPLDRKVLETKVNLSRVPTALLHLTLKLQKDRAKKEELAELLQEEKRESLLSYLQEHSLLRFLAYQSPLSYPFDQFIQTLPPLLPRFYSISSSQTVHKTQADLLVATFHYFHGQEELSGLGSSFLCERAILHKTTIPTYLHPTKNFTLPSNPHTPILMIGPGTGVAPYRAFLQERMFQKQGGKNWLFFGERNRAYDFYYREFFEKLQGEGKLQLDLAFSRDQREKVYVQDLLYQKKEEVWQWVEEGAYLYVCGDAKKMAKAVEETLEKIAAEERNMSREQAKGYLLTLRREGRYRTDVY